MKILRVIVTMNPAYGGPCQGIRNSVEALAEQGIDNEVLSFDLPNAPFLKDDNFITHAIGPAKSPYAYTPHLTAWLKDHIHRFDAIIVHGLWLYTSYGTYKAWKKIKAKNPNTPNLYIMPHGMLDPYFQKAQDRRLKALRNNVFWELSEKKAVNNASGLLFTCEQELLLAKTTFPRYAPRVELNVGYGIKNPPENQVSFYSKFEEHCPTLKKEYFLFLGRIHPKKGVDLLLYAYLNLLEQQPGLPDLVIAGPGLDTDFGESMLALGDHPKIHFPGMLRGDGKWGAFYGCEAFILPSHQENFGIAVAEAMACKKPVLISDQVNIWREIKLGDAGLVFGDTQSGVHQALTAFLQMTIEKREQIGENAYATYKKHFSIQKAAKKMIDQLNLVT